MQKRLAKIDKASAVGLVLKDEKVIVAPGQLPAIVNPKQRQNQNIDPGKVEAWMALSKGGQAIYVVNYVNKLDAGQA